MKTDTKPLLLFAALGILAIYPLQKAHSSPTQPSTGTSTTAANQGAELNDAITPFSQSNDPADLKVTQQIRRAIIAQPNLSVDAQNIKIITTPDHVVYLKGVVDSSVERKTIVHLAKKIAGHDKLKNDLLLPSETQNATANK